MARTSVKLDDLKNDLNQETQRKLDNAHTRIKLLESTWKRDQETIAYLRKQLQSSDELVKRCKKHTKNGKLCANCSFKERCAEL